jgi:3-oxoacyl-[acyl-carrier protein] reductase
MHENSYMDLGIAGCVAVVTGADSGIGHAVAKLLCAEGVKVVLTDQYEDELARATAALDSQNAWHYRADVTRTSEVEALADAARQHFGPPNILVHCAGITGPTGQFHELSDDDWRLALDVIFMGAVRVARAFIPGMAAQGWGRVVLTGSEDALQPYADELPYCAAKAGILNLAKGLSKTYAAKGVLVNAVSPAFIATPMTDAMMNKRAKEKKVSFDEAVESFLDEERPTLELHRRGKAEEVAATMVYLCSRQASFINGANVRVDGGSVASL